MIIVVYVEVVKPSMVDWAIVIVTGTNPREGIICFVCWKFTEYPKRKIIPIVAGDSHDSLTDRA